MKRTILGAAAITMMVAAPVLAQSEMDTDGDGVYSFTEMLVAFPTLTEETFITIDANGDGGVDDTELASAQEAGVLPAT